MKNSLIKEEILVIRQIRRKLGSINLRFMSNEEKAMALKALNDYESSLENDREKNMHAKEELDSQGITNDIEDVEIPIDLDRPAYKEFATSGSHEPLSANIIRLKDVDDSISSFNFSDQELDVFKRALKYYCHSLEHLQQTSENHAKRYGNEYLDSKDSINVPKDLVASRPYTPTMTQREMRNELFNMLSQTNSKDEDSKSK